MNRRILALCYSVGVFAVGACFAACGSSSSSSSPTSGTPNGGAIGDSGTAPDVGTGATSGSATSGAASGAATSGSATDDGGEDGGVSAISTAPGSCANPTIVIDFTPMYSAFIPGDTAVHFQIPAVADDGNAATWSLSDPTQAQLEAQMFPVGADMVPGVLITVLGLGDDAGPGPGQITVVASRSDGSCGTSTLNITANTADDYTIGQQRYNDGVALSLTRPAGFPDGGFPEGGFGGMGMMTADGGSFYERDGGTACTNCHGMNATNSAYKTVSHTPEQTGGFSDSQLIGIITQGNIPDGGYFDPSVIIPSCDGGAACTQMAFDTWHAFHQWADITPDEYAGIVVYLRALTPAPQTGVPGFAGGGRRMRGDGGMRPPPPFADAAAGSDAAPDAADAGAE